MKLSEQEKESRYHALLTLRNDILSNTSLPLFAYRKAHTYFPVIGEGSLSANIVFVGEAPGKNEAEQGRPFCGASGRMLNSLLATIKLSRSDVYITNIVKDRPPENRDPLSEEITAYGPYLDRQIAIIKPKIIATLGRFSMAYITEKYSLPMSTISETHGNEQEIFLSDGSSCVFIPLYHPAAAIYNPKQKQVLAKDMLKIKEILKKLC